jgi:hypothetical protein
MPRPRRAEITNCPRDHQLAYEYVGGRLRCPECRREDNRARDQRRRAEARAGLPPRSACPYCRAIPCHCEEL